MDKEPKPVCGHKYTTLGNRVFRCTKEPHPNKPDAHYFERDLKAQDERAAAERDRRRRRGLTLIPGERR